MLKQDRLQRPVSPFHVIFTPTSYFRGAIVPSSVVPLSGRKALSTIEILPSAYDFPFVLYYSVATLFFAAPLISFHRVRQREGAAIRRVFYVIYLTLGPSLLPVNHEPAAFATPRTAQPRRRNSEFAFGSRFSHQTNLPRQCRAS